MKAAFVSAALLALAAAAPAAELTLEVQGLSSEQGMVMVAVFDSAEGWLRKPVAVAQQPAAGHRGGVLQIVVKDVSDGALAVSAFHDLNGNGRPDMNAMGVPLEPFAFSNDAAGLFGPAKFEQARFEMKGSARIVVKFN